MIIIIISDYTLSFSKSITENEKVRQMAKEHVESIFANKELSSTDKIAYIYWLNQMCTEVFDIIGEAI